MRESMGSAPQSRFVPPWFRMHLIALVCLAVLSLSGRPAFSQAADPNDEYLNVYGLIQDADALSTSGQRDAAIAKYQKAGDALVQLHKRYPNWNTKVVAFRMDYVAQKLAALSVKPAAATNTESAASNRAAGDSTANAAADQSVVKLLSPGAEPRKALRLHPKAGDKQSFVMTVKLAMTTQIGAADAPSADIPPMKMTMDLGVNSVSPEGDITYQSVLSDAAVVADPNTPAPTLEMMKASLAPMKGLTATVTISDRGRTKVLDMKSPPGANPQAGQMLEQMRQIFSSVSAPFPDEEVGLGAKWEARLPVKSQGMTIDQTATYELTASDGDRLTLRNSVAQHAANQKVQNPAMPGLKLDLTQMSGTAVGTLTLDLNQIVPREASLDSHSTLAMVMNAGGQKQTIKTKIAVAVQLQPK